MWGLGAGLLAALAGVLVVASGAAADSLCPDFVGQAETFLGSLKNVQRAGEPDSLLKVFPDQHPWACCQLCKEQDYCEYFTWQSTGVDVQEVPVGDCKAFNETTCQDNGSGFLPFDEDKHGAYSGSLSQCERPEERFLRKALLAKHEALEIHESSKLAAAAVRVARLAQVEGANGAAAEELVEGALSRLDADTPARRMSIEGAAVSDVDSASYGPCPSLAAGTWEIGKLRSVKDANGLSTQLEVILDNAAPRECCSSCQRYPGCQFWTWTQPYMHAPSGQCHLFSEAACQTGSDGLLPFEIGDKLSRTGTDICTAAVTLSATYEEQKTAAIGEVHAALSASVAVKSKQLAALEAEEKSADEARAAAEKAAEDDEKLVRDAKAKEESAAAALEAAKQAEKDAAAVLAAAKKSKAEAEAKAKEQEAIAEKAKREEKKIKKELKAAKVAKASAENIKASEFMIQDRTVQEDHRKHPYRRCPTFTGSEFHVGTFREVKTDNTSSLLKEGSKGVYPMDCCKECSSTEGCKYWSWVKEKLETHEGDCTLFTDAECAAVATDAAADAAELPYERFNKLGRVGTSTCS